MRAGPTAFVLASACVRACVHACMHVHACLRGVKWRGRDTFLLVPMIYELWAAAFRLALGAPHTAWLRWLDLSSDICFVLDVAVAVFAVDFHAETSQFEFS